jgi:hypothetical protein
MHEQVTLPGPQATPGETPRVSALPRDLLEQVRGRVLLLAGLFLIGSALDPAIFLIGGTIATLSGLPMIFGNVGFMRAGAAAGRWVGACGGIAGDPVGALIFTGLGVDELSMSLPSIAVKAAMRRYSLGQAREFARRALACVTADDVRALPLP